MTGRGFDTYGVRAANESLVPTAARTPALPSFKELYRAYSAFVWSTVRRFGVSPSETDDVMQEVFMVIHSRLHTLEKPEALRSWIYSVVRRTASRHRRAREKPGATTNEGELGYSEARSWEPTPLENTERYMGLQLLFRLLDALEQSKREILALVEIDELSVPQAAQILKIPVNTAYSRLRTARHAFEAALASARRDPLT